MSSVPYSIDETSGVTFNRAFAWIIDMVIITVLAALVLPFTAFTGVFFFPLLMMVIGFMYRWFTIAGRSATLGMRIVGICLRDLYGRPLSSGTAFAHTAGYTISVLVAPLQLISVILMLVSNNGKGLTDHLLGTRAIRVS